MTTRAAAKVCATTYYNDTGEYCQSLQQDSGSVSLKLLKGSASDQSGIQMYNCFACLEHQASLHAFTSKTAPLTDPVN